MAGTRTTERKSGLIDAVRFTSWPVVWSCSVKTRLSPAWTTDWMSERGRERLREFGIAPPSGHRPVAAGRVSLSLQRRQVACPQCGSTDTEEIARFGSTACKALRRCLTCREPFDEFKTL